MSCNNSWYNTAWGRANHCDCRVPVPSVSPPWSRPTVSPQIQYLFDSGVVVLTCVTTYLTQATPADPDNLDTPYALTIADGNYRQQRKEIFIPGDFVATTAPWNLTGTFGGFTSITFNTLGTSAILNWDGSAWQLVGGNAQVNLT